jgi:3-hydroxyanthranilate 3,4-dioxygenase
MLHSLQLVFMMCRWYCEKCNEILYEEKFQVKTMDLGGALKPIIEDFYADEKKRTCKKCGHVTPPPPEKQKQ